jgi:PAS domain S-box-containing protein
VDILHMLSYKGMGVFGSAGADLSTQLWISSRYIESISFLAAYIFIKKKLKANIAVTAYLTVTALILLSIFHWKVFPACFVEGTGLTSFKIISEYIISLIFLLAVFILIKNKEKFDKVILRLLVASLIVTIFSEIVFTFYSNVYGFFNMLGHYFKLISFYLIYKAIIQTGLRDPFDLLFKDLEKKKEKLKKAYFELEAILNSIANGLIITDNHKRVVLMNKAVEEILNVRFDDVVNKHIDHAIKEETLRDRFKEMLIKKKSGHQFDFELLDSNLKYPKIMRAITSVIYDKENKERGIVTIIYDITHEKETDRVKTEFLTKAAHEIRTPLTRHIEAGIGISLKKAICNINSCIKNIVQYFKDYSKKHNFKLILPEKDIVLNVDRDKFKLVMENLLSNAIKYSPNGGAINVIAEEKENEALFVVEDEGVGMTKEQVEKVFENFYRTDSYDTETEKTGLGMNIVMHVIKAHGGRIWIESEKDKGTKVKFAIPIK